MYSKTVKLLSVLLLLSVVAAMSSCSFFGSKEEETTTALVTLNPPPGTAEDVVGYFNSLMNGLKGMKPGMTMEQKRELKDVKSTNDKGDVKEIDALIAIAKGYIKELEQPKDIVSDYNADLTDFLPLKGTPVVSRLTAADVISAECKIEMRQVNYKDVENPACYLLDIHLTPEGMGKVFDIGADDKSAILAKFQEYTDNVTVSDYTEEFTDDCWVKLRIDSRENHITQIEYIKSTLITSDVVWSVELESWGETTVSFVIKETVKYKDFKWTDPTSTTTEEAA